MNIGIYTLANDRVYDLVVALLNSIHANFSKEIPVCIIPYDHNTELVEKEIAKRKNVFLFEDQNSLEKWTNFIKQIHDIYYNFPFEVPLNKKTNSLGMHRRYCAFDGSFDKFVYFDADTLVFQPLDHVYQKLDDYDFVVHDFQRKTSLVRKEVSHFFEAYRPLYDSEETLAHRFHCSGFWGSRRGFIDENDLEYFLKELREGDIKIFKTDLYEQIILNYMTFKKRFKLYNFTLDDSSEHNTGSCITSSHFENKNYILYDRGKKLTYLHYMGVKSEHFRRLAAWKKMNIPNNDGLMYLADKFFKWQIRSIPYKEIFLYYRFLTCSK